MNRLIAPAICLVLLGFAAAAEAQVSITGAIAGTVMDTSDAVLPGATVTLRDEGTGAQKETITNGAGAFAFQNLNFGSYQVTVKLTGFQSALYSKVIVESGRTTDLRVKLSIGRLDEAVTVVGTSPVLERSSNVISTTLSNKDVNELPLAGRDAFAFARLMPGAATPQGSGSTHFNGLPGGTINPTIDGVNNSSNGFKSGGTSFFGTVRARLGAVEQVTVETAGLGGDDGVTGGVNLKFVTRRGTNRYQGSFFEQYRTDKLNANTFGNEARGLPKDKLRRHDFGGNFGGPIFRSGPLANKLFAFVNYEMEWIPQTQVRTATLLTEEARAGVFRYTTSTGEARTVDVLQLAGNMGQQSAKDPTMSALLAQEASARQYGVTEPGGNLRVDTLSWSEPQKQINKYPTLRLDYQIKNNLSFMASYNEYAQDAQGRRQWPIPGFPINNDTFDSGWWIWSTGTNWTINSSMHNELRFGIQHSGDTNEVGRQKEFFDLNGQVNGQAARFTLPLVTLLVADNAPVIGRHYITTITDTLSYIKGNHTVKFGGNYRDTQWRDRDLQGANTGGYLGLPRYAIGVAAADPVASAFTTTTMPGAATADLTAAQQLYALLTGRLTEVRTGAVIDPVTLEYKTDVFRENWTSAWFAGLFAQDSWRVNPNFTLNMGLRYEINAPPFNHTDTVLFPNDANIFGPSTRLFAPGELNGVQDPVYERLKVAAGTDWMNIAPRVGFAWTPHFGDNIWGKIFGRGEETVFRGGYDLTYFDEGTNMFASTAGNNTGHSQVRLATAGTNFAFGSTLQSPLPAFVYTPAAYQSVLKQSEIAFVSGLSSMFSDLRTGYVNAFNIGLQRQIAKNTVIEVRYLANDSKNLWHTFNLNEVNIFENGFLDQFKAAQTNLAINEAAGSTGFANQGRPGQVATPIFDNAFGSRGSQAALASTQGYTSANFITNLKNGEAGRMATSMATNSTYLCRMLGSNFSPCLTGGRNFNAPGPYPMNFFMVNPYAVSGLNVVDDDGWSKYQALQLQFRRRYANWLTANVNYTLAKNTGNLFTDNATQSVNFFTLRNKELNDGPTPHDVRHALQAYGTYDLPFGRGRKVGIENSVLNAVAGGWTLGGVFSAQSGTPIRLISGRQTVNGSDSGVVLMNGHTVEDIQKLINIRSHPTQPASRYWADAALIGADGRASAEYLGPPTTPGEFGQILYLRGMNPWSFDMSLNKTTGLVGKSQITVHITIQNVLNKAIWSTPGFLGTVDITSTTFGVTTNPVNNTTSRNLYSRITIQF